MHISHKSFTQWHAINNVNVSMIWIVIIIIYESIYWNPMRTGNFTWRTWLEYFRLIENAFTSIFMDFRTWASKLCKLTELNLWAVFGLWVGLMTVGHQIRNQERKLIDALITNFFYEGFNSRHGLHGTGTDCVRAGWNI